MVVSKVKKGNGIRAKKYRGITLMVTLYKVYTMILQERVREEVESKEIIKPN